MKINRVESEQFAGIKNSKVELKEGLNIILGNNEAGKSTLVDLIYNLFFSAISMKGKEKKDFINIYFPNNILDVSGDVVDGTISFDTSDGTYELSKEWRSNKGSCKLILPDKTKLVDEKKINEILAEVLQFGKGIYDELIFSSQKRNNYLMEGILKNAEGKGDDSAVKELSSYINQVVMETGGYNVDAIGAEIDAMLKLYNEDWDDSIDEPRTGKLKRGVNNKWNSSTTEKADRKEQAIILRDYYDMEEAKEKVSMQEDAERKIGIIHGEINRKKQIKTESIRKQDEFAKYQVALSTIQKTRELLSSEEESNKKLKTVLSDWPDKKIHLEQLVKLSDERSFSQMKKQYEIVSQISQEILEKREKLSKIKEVPEEDISRYEEATQAVEMHKCKMSGMNAKAIITEYGENKAIVTKLVNGELIENENPVKFDEAVKISVPGVVEIDIVPGDVDMEKMMKEVEKNEAIIAEINSKYSVNNPKELRYKQKQFNDEYTSLKLKEQSLNFELKGANKEDILKKGSDMEKSDRAIRSEAEIDNDIENICKGQSIENCIGAYQNSVHMYEQEYGSIDKLEKRISESDEKILKYKNSICENDDIPEEFKDIVVEDYVEELKNTVAACEETLEGLYSELSAVEKKCGDYSLGELEEDLREKKAIFEEDKDTYLKWKHIKQVFVKLVDDMKGKPMDDVRKHFEKYLCDMTADKLKVSALEENMSTEVISGTNKLNSSILSAGTKDVMELALRLSVLEHLYPDGGAVVVLDDPLTEMDPDRVRMACKLISSFSEKNQVIFITCDDKYVNKYFQGEVASVISL